jgi:hypothetical protein
VTNPIPGFTKTLLEESGKLFALLLMSPNIADHYLRPGAKGSQASARKQLELLVHQSRVAEWLEAKCESAPGEWCNLGFKQGLGKGLYEEYFDWCKARRYTPQSDRKFAPELLNVAKQAGRQVEYHRNKRRGSIVGNWFEGIRLRAHDSNEPTFILNDTIEDVLDGGVE